MKNNIALLWENVIFQLNKNNISTPSINIVFVDDAVQQQIIDFAMNTGIESVIRAAEKCKPHIGEIMTDAEHKQYKDTLAEVEGFLNPSHSHKPQVAVKANLSVDWDLLEKCAKEVSGPVGTIILKKVKNSNPGDTTMEAATKMAAFLGDFSADFLKLVKENLD